MGAYQDNLQHVAEPQKPKDRDKACSVSIADYEALWFARALREFGYYQSDDVIKADIAIAYASFIDQKIRDQDFQSMKLYMHSYKAAQTLQGTIAMIENGTIQEPQVVIDSAVKTIKNDAVYSGDN